MLRWVCPSASTCRLPRIRLLQPWMSRDRRGRHRERERERERGAPRPWKSIHPLRSYTFIMDDARILWQTLLWNYPMQPTSFVIHRHTHIEGPVKNPLLKNFSRINRVVTVSLVVSTGIMGYMTCSIIRNLFYCKVTRIFSGILFTCTTLRDH